MQKKCSVISAASFEPGWQQYLTTTFEQDYITNLKIFLNTEKKAQNIIFPSCVDIFNAFNLTPFDKVKIVILGQDPYHGVGQAQGLAFSVPENIKIPPSLVNIYKEIYNDLNSKNNNVFTIPKHGCLKKWAAQGVLLLNTVLTVRAHEAHSHRNQGWEVFTDNIIKLLSANKSNLVFMLWGSPAKAKINLIDTNKHLVLTAAHPSPLSAHRGFLGCKHFSKANDYLSKFGLDTIDWQV